MGRDDKQVGSTIDNSRYVHQVVKYISEGESNSQIRRLLRDRFGFKVSLPTISGFKRNYYPKRKREIQDNAESFQKNQVSRIQTYIDEATAQSDRIKEAIQSLTEHVKQLEEDIAFSTKFNKMFRTAVDNFVDYYDPENPRDFLGGLTSSPEEESLVELKNRLEEEGSTLSTYICRHNPNSNLRLLSSVHKQLLDYRKTIESIHRDIFKSYRNYSILQEVTVIFEKYNGIIVEEFFSDRKHMDVDKYNIVRKKIFTLFQEFQIRYQGVESPSRVPDSKNISKSSSVSSENSKTKNSKKEIIPEEAKNRMKESPDIDLSWIGSGELPPEPKEYD